MNELMQIDNLGMEELQILSEKIMAKKMTMLQKQVEEVKSDLSKTNEKVKNIENQQAKTLDVAINSMRVNQPKYGYVNQGDFGRFFTVSIGAKTLGKLLKIVGIAMKNKNDATPYRDRIPKYAITEAYEKYTAVKWNYDECLNVIDKWLKENGYFESFYSCKTQSELEKFINSIYEKFSSDSTDYQY